MGIKVIITGSTGMVGKSVLLECIRSETVESILIVNRKSTGINNPKLKEVLHDDFLNLEPIKNELSDYDACRRRAFVLEYTKSTKSWHHLPKHQARFQTQQFHVQSHSAAPSTKSNSVSSLLFLATTVLHCRRPVQIN